MTEQQLQKKIVTLLERSYDCYVVKVISASKSGVPDLLICYQGLFIAIEVKRPETKTTVTKLQKYNLDKVTSVGGYSLVAWNTEMVIDFMDSL